MRFSVKHSMSKAACVLGLLGAAFTQVGCAHPVAVEPSVAVHSRIGHFPVYTQVGVPGPVIYAPSPRVIYAPPPPPRVVFVPRVAASVHGWGHGSDGRHWSHERGQYRTQHGGPVRGVWDRRHDGRR